MDVFACQRCDAAPEPIPGSNAVIVRHGAGCVRLAERIKARWPLTASELPGAPNPQPFAQKAAWSRWHKAVLAIDARHRASERQRV
jgi:hypothetical protein